VIVKNKNKFFLINSLVRNLIWRPTWGRVIKKF